MIKKDKFLKAKVLVIGDILYDQYIYGDVSRVSPEAPVPILKFLKEEMRVGGAGNVASNIASLGSQAMLIGFLGDDIKGEFLLKKLNEKHIFNKIVLLKDQQTITKQRIVSKLQHIVRIDFDNGYVEEKKHSILSLVKENINDYDLIVLSDYGKGTLKEIEKIIQLANSLNKLIIVDPKGNDFAKYKNCSILTPNLKEFEEIVGKCSNEHEIISKAKKLNKELKLDALLLTRGEKGMILISKDDIVKLDAISRDVFDVTGAGDTVIATLAASISAGYQIREALTFANIAAGVAVSKFGTSSVSLNDIQVKLNTNKKNFKNKLIDRIDLISKIEILKKNNPKIVMTNGCFDILHMGHVRYLKEAKSLGDVLLVGLNSDISIKNIKGSQRPINNELSRLEVLSALECVDIITVFDEDTPLEIIKLIKPHVLVKAGDYKSDEVVGSKFVKQNNGKVKILTYYDGYSTTNSIKKIIENS
jgi:D-beta-D-heptose 7-phosphate kinase/D-beta-D-heptose 1-phosphate adenosyltransferase